MAVPNNKIVTPEHWLQARMTLLEKEKQHTRLTDQLARERSELPMTLVTKDYIFTSQDGSKVSLLDMFDDKQQLIVHHIMFSPMAKEACVHCGYHLDNLPANLAHLEEKNTRYVVTARAPYEKLKVVSEARPGWQVPVFSTYESDFNYDFHVTLDKDIKSPVTYNYEASSGKGELPGMSVFLRDAENKVYHTYSTYARGVEHLMPTLALLDLTPLGRQD